MSFDVAAVRQYLQTFDFKNLFTQELGWENHAEQLALEVEGETYALEGVAHKRGIVAYVCAPDSEGRIPAYRLRRKIEARVTKSAYEHILVFTDRTNEQVWQWMRREKGKTTVPREAPFYANTSGDLLIQKLRGIMVELDEEDALTLTAQAEKNRRAFDVETVTKSFYTGFKAQHAQFVAAIAPHTLPKEDREWYTSVMLNRLMFLYFIQRKGFLDGDTEYLQNRLARVRQEHGSDQFFTFYRHFLLRLFHEGLGQPTHTPELEQLIGRVPYLNGGLFTEHAIERKCREQNVTLHIPDEVFANVFAFFKGYDWHLDNRKNKSGKEINPDVLGYIFEKYINYNEAGQKENGAYYTKEDITEYIGRSTILPYLLDTAQSRHGSAFAGSDSVWKLLRADPDKYIFPAVKHGMTLPLPPEIEAGIGDVSKRGEWNKPAPSGEGQIALPTEIWRETVARRQRCAELRDKLAKGEIRAVNDLITYNLDIRQFVTDCITEMDNPNLLRALWQAIKNARVLDPTVGSGAFLFAALNILEPLYERCLERMEAYVGDKIREESAVTWAGVMAFNEISAQQSIVDVEEYDADYAGEFKAELAHVNSPQHPNRPYFIHKSIIVSNLFGVDIMEEATEICKLRLFLKLVAQVEPDAGKPNMGVEPLPDVDFNIRAGNTLVGFATRKEVDAHFNNPLGLEWDAQTLLDGLIPRLETYATQTLEGTGNPELKSEIEEIKSAVNTVLNDEELKRRKLSDRAAFEKSHQPFHWLVEFPKVMASGGFDIIIGNPPYLSLSGFNSYTFLNYSTRSTNNLYPMILERCLSFFTKRGRQGYIIPVSSIATEGYLPLQNLLANRELIFSSYDDRPAHLFTGLDKNTLSILLIGEQTSNFSAYSTRLCRWNAMERETLFQKLEYQRTVVKPLKGCLPKLGSCIETKIWDKIFAEDCPLSKHYEENTDSIVYYSRKVNAFLQVLDFVPEVRDGKGNLRPPSEFKCLNFSNHFIASAVYCCLSSTLFRWFLDVVSDGSHLNKREVDGFPFDAMRQSTDLSCLPALAARLTEVLKSKSESRVMRYGHDTLTVQCIMPKYAKTIVDEIDRTLAHHYNFTSEELDFILNYDLKYRMSRNAES